MLHISQRRILLLRRKGWSRVKFDRASGGSRFNEGGEAQYCQAMDSLAADLVHTARTTKIGTGSWTLHAADFCRAFPQVIQSYRFTYAAYAADIAYGLAAMVLGGATGKMISEAATERGLAPIWLAVTIGALATMIPDWETSWHGLPIRRIMKELEPDRPALGEAVEPRPTKGEQVTEHRQKSCEDVAEAAIVAAPQSHPPGRRPSNVAKEVVDYWRQSGMELYEPSSIRETLGSDQFIAALGDTRILESELRVIARVCKVRPSHKVIERLTSSQLTENNLRVSVPDIAGAASQDLAATTFACATLFRILISQTAGGVDASQAVAAMDVLGDSPWSTHPDESPSLPAAPDTSLKSEEPTEAAHSSRLSSYGVDYLFMPKVRSPRPAESD